MEIENEIVTQQQTKEKHEGMAMEIGIKQMPCFLSYKHHNNGQYPFLYFSDN